MEGKYILNSIIEKGGLMASCAKIYAHDKSLSDQFIRECYSHCDIPEVEGFWGDELVNRMKDYINSL